MNHRREFRRQLIGWEFAPNEIIHLRRRKKLERDLATETSRLQVELQLRERVLGKQQLRRPHGGQDQQSHLAKARREIREDVDGREIRSMEIVEKKDDRSQLAQLVHERAQLALHPLLRVGLDVDERTLLGRVVGRRRSDLQIPRWSEAFHQ